MLPSQLAPSLLPDDQLTLPLCKQYLQQFHTWLTSRFTAGDNVMELVSARTLFIDQLLCRLWERFGLYQHPHLALVAVGGYGRGELHPHSDIDILILSKKSLDATSGETVSQFLTQLWDLRLEVGHAVRSVKECVRQGKDDITIATNLLEARLLTGSQATFKELQAATLPRKFWPSDAFFRAKREEQALRYQQFKDTAYLLEPDIKHNPGGLRDIQTLAWVARRQLGATTLYEMTSFGFLNQAEYLELKDCQEFLWRIRFALHLVIGKNDNRLLFDRQRLVAKELGYPGEGNAPVEQMMKRFYQTVRRVAELNDMLLQLFDQAILGNDEPQVSALNEKFLLRGKLIDVRDPSLFARDPASILELFYQVAEHPQVSGIYAGCLRHLREARRSQVIALQELPECRQLFMAILRHPNGIGLPMTLMHRHGVLATYLPQWGQIVGQMQFDMFHAYTVDEHTHRLLVNINRFTRPDNPKEQPLFREVHSRLAKPELLYLAALFHDIAKGRGGDHSELGAGDALYFCQLHGLDRSDSRLVAWLVRHHLLLSVTAQRRDIYDPDVVTEFAQKVRDEQRLAYLYCLTVADICATNDSLWNDWKGTLLKELYFACVKALRLGLENPPDLRLRIRDNQSAALQLLQQQGIPEAAAALLWQQFKADYFLRMTPEQIAWHTQHILRHGDSAEPLVLFGHHKTRGGTELFLYCRDMPNLFALVASVLDHKNLNIHDAQIMIAKNDFVMDTFVVLEPNGEQLDAERLTLVRQTLEQVLRHPEQPLPRHKAPSRRHRQFQVPTCVNFLPSKGDKKHSLIELITLDRPGLLAKIGAVFQTCQLSVHSAKITTIGERVEDFFSLSRLDGSPLDDHDRQQLEEKLVTQLNPATDV